MSGFVNGFTVEETGLQAAGHRLASIADELDVEVAAVVRRVEELLATGWQGVAAQDFAAAWSEWQHGFRGSRAGLRQMAQLLDDTAVVYGRAEQAAVAGLRRAQAALS